jgi:signal transduction histidine kinase
LEAANRKLELLVASKTDFVASVSHELRTPLTSVIGFAELLMDSSSEFNREQRHDLLSAIADQGYELANIVEDLLVAARSEMGDLSVSQVSVNLKAQTAQVIESMRNEEAKSIVIAGEPQFAIADPQRVRQILRNLLTNAIRYGGPNIGVRIDDSVGGLVAVIVSDDGLGISDEARERIFERYEQEGVDTGVSDSFGLGLAISRALARLMGGELACQRTDVTEFILSLPIDSSRHQV